MLQRLIQHTLKGKIVRPAAWWLRRGAVLLGVGFFVANGLLGAVHCLVAPHQMGPQMVGMAHAHHLRAPAHPAAAHPAATLARQGHGRHAHPSKGQLAQPQHPDGLAWNAAPTAPHTVAAADDCSFCFTHSLALTAAKPQSHPAPRSLLQPQGLAVPPLRPHHLLPGSRAPPSV